MNKESLIVGIVFGGASGEHDVSIKSAVNVINALRDKNNINRFKVVSFYIDKQGQWWTGSIAEEVLHKGASFNESKSIDQINFKGLDTLPQEIKKIQTWFPILHGPNGEDGTIQGFFKLTGKPFVGSGILGSALGMDKIAMKAAFHSAGLPQVKYCNAFANDLSDKKKLTLLVQQIESKLGYPCFIKPANLGSSVGITKAYNNSQILEGLRNAAKLDNRIVIEKSIQARELECAVLGKKEISTSCIGEVRYNSDWYDYETKYSGESSRVIIPAPISNKLSQEIRKLSLVACKAISVEGIARVDFFYEEKKNCLWINEINTIPGFTSKSMYPMLWEASGLNLSQLVARLVESASE